MSLFKQTIEISRRTASTRLTTALLAAVSGAVLLAASPLPATASPADGAPTVAVQYGDLDLATEQGARILLERIEVAANQVCPAVADNRALGEFKARARCMREATSRAVEQVGSPRLAAVLSSQARHG